MIRLIATLLMLTTMAGGYMYYDFRMSARLAGRADADGLSFAEYLSGLTDRLAGLSDAASAGGMPTRLADMLPKAPEGWKLRAASAEDLRPFLPKSLAKADKAAVAALEALLSGVSGNGTEVAIRAYQKGDRTVLVQAVRYPNLIFTSSAALKERAALQAISAQFGAADVMTVRGLDVTEDLLPEDFRGRLFLADVGGQIHLRLLAPRRMKDTELLPFFETLNVEAMNASVIDKVEGLGKVPLIVLASALDDTDREAYVAARARRAADKAQRQEEARSATEVQTAAPPSRGSLGIGALIGGLFGLSNATGATAPAQAAPVQVDCATGKNGVKRCMVSEDAGG
ncbi:hypothetical protein [Tabrizicola thermarum]|uniref:hypothetical protein n=1 Tax=Tabrizicola thermarum TaxID=2670345 RepID=UPI000FFC70BE|nr:hypothetical protein [Tabrizicola thermarum]